MGILGNPKEEISSSAQAPASNTGISSGLLSGGLPTLFGRLEVRGLYYNGKYVVLDGYKFINCRFDNCLLHVSSNNFEIVECVIDPTTKIEYSSSVAKLFQLFLSRFQWAAQYFPAGFVSKKNHDGSETISDVG